MSDGGSDDDKPILSLVAKRGTTTKKVPRLESDDDDEFLVKARPPIAPPINRKRARVDHQINGTSVQPKPEPSQRVKRAPSQVKREVKSPTARTGAATRKRKPVFSEDGFEPINTWWDQPLRKKDDPQWHYLEHSGLMFHPSYVPHGIPMLYENRQVVLPPKSEEVANFWCGAQTSDYPLKARFVANFWAAFLSTFPEDHEFLKPPEPKPPSEQDASAPVTKPEAEQAPPSRKKARMSKAANEYLPSLEKADFTDIRLHLEATKAQEKEARRQLNKEEREVERRLRLKVEGPHMFALHDSIREKVASYKAEVPGLFRGRGEHPKMGKLKRRIFPDEVVLNLSEDAPVPRLPAWLKGHSWQDVYHDPSVTWLAFYRDTVNHQFKYVFLGASSAVKGMKDFLKYELARNLKQHIASIRKDYRGKMQSDDVTEMQLGTATYVIDALALRVGNEKDREEEADTVGCCSLRVEHVTAFNDEQCQITLDFLGKDSIRYLNTVTLDPLAYKNVKSFCNGKHITENIFDTTSTGALNRYLKDLMPGLSAKVFRTYNASVTLQDELSKINEIEHQVDKSNIEDCKRFYEHANRQVAILCNHQRSIPKQFDSSMEKMQKTLVWLNEDIAEVEAYINFIKQDPKSRKKEFVFKAQARSPEDPPRSSVVKANLKDDQAAKKLHQLKNKRINLELRIRVKDENKTVSNNTSKQHYMDPRITVTFCKKYDLPIEKFFNTSLLKKFPWAMYAKSDFVW